MMDKFRRLLNTQLSISDAIIYGLVTYSFGGSVADVMKVVLVTLVENFKG